MVRRYLDASQLPARPDGKTGIPRPPHAPSFVGGKSENEMGRTAAVPEPPLGQGPVLDWSGYGRRYSLGIGFALAVFVGIFLAITRSIDWVKVPSIWIVIAITVLLGYSVMRFKRFSAGADWFAVRDRWVKIYELVEISARTSGTGVYITLKDRDCQKVEYKFTDLGLGSRLMYDLVYNGILYSTIAGEAKTNSLLHRTLKLPYPASARAPSKNEDSAE